ncbi:unnamed protein product [Cyclocybe aegerita]|uniref:Uncharacterized protein n=1 Tax=Cyclocybe aegerita TaxID=1973307 RepID=A0A8S0WL70_CYCAE|nr:unnamed protein product [Cyclocybe aegerita]
MASFSSAPRGTFLVLYAKDVNIDTDDLVQLLSSSTATDPLWPRLGCFQLTSAAHLTLPILAEIATTFPLLTDLTISIDDIDQNDLLTIMKALKAAAAAVYDQEDKTEHPSQMLTIDTCPREWDRDHPAVAHVIYHYMIFLFPAATISIPELCFHMFGNFHRDQPDFAARFERLTLGGAENIS